MSAEHSKRSARVTEDCFAAVIRAYVNSPKFESYSDNSRRLWRRELEFMARPDCLGAVSVNEIRPKLVQDYFDALAGMAYKQAAALTALKQLEKWAVVRDILPRSITLGVEIEDADGGHIPWTDEQVALAEEHCRPELARAITLAANTGQRGSDLIRMGWSDIEMHNGLEGISLKQRKTGRDVWIPILSTLAAAMKTWERRPGPFLTRTDGRPWTRSKLTFAWWYERDNNPALAPLRACGPDKDKPLVLHGLRGHACVRLLRAGATTRQVSDMVGMSEQMVGRYTRFSVQRDNASAAVINLERTIRERNIDIIAKGGS